MNARSSPSLSFTDVGRGEAVVLLHAFPLDGRMWDEQKRALAPRWRVVVPDLAGFGASAGIRGRSTLDDHADDVVQLFDALGIERASVVGLSMGGYIALALARRHPKRLARLGLADTRAAPDSLEGKAGRDQNIALVASNGVAPLVERLLPKLLSGGAPDDVTALVRRIGNSQSPAAVEAALGAMRDRVDATSLLANIEVPTAVIVGEADAIAPPAEARGVADALARGELHVIPRAGHLSNLEAPKTFLEALVRLLERS